MKAVVAAFNQEKALVGAFSVITNLRMELFQALVTGNILRTVLGQATYTQISDLNPSLPQMIQFGADAERSNSICGEI